MLKLVQRLNPTVRLEVLRPDDKVSLPTLSIRSYTASGAFAGDDPAQVGKKEAIQKNWQKLSPFTVDKPDGSTWLAYKAYELYFPTSDDRASEQIVERLKSVRSTNVLLNVLRATPHTEKLFSNSTPTIDEVKAGCLTGTVGPVVYRDYANGDMDAFNAAKKYLPPTLTTVPVFIIDTPLVASPNLYPAYGAEPVSTSWRCKWETPFTPALHHATHLAGIIASQGDRFGFIGLAPRVKLTQFIWIVPGDNGGVKPSSNDRQFKLANMIVANEKSGEPLRVYMIASLLDPLPGQLAAGQLLDPGDRFRERLRQTIRINHPLLIVAAGQSDPGAPPVDISPKSPFAPMDLGDQDNVLVVTACVECVRDKATLLPNAWYSSGDHKIVHVAAPGGDSVPGWVSNDGIGAASGTSQAAAYVTGVAASMIGAFPSVYTQARFVKQRLQATSWPIGPNADGTINPNAEKVATGIIDPILAQLHPSRHWLKVGGDWKDVRIKGFSIDSLPYRDVNGYNAQVITGSILRIVSTGTSGTTVYVDRNTAGTGEVGEVGRVGPLTLNGKAAVVLCDGTSMDLSGMSDLILAIQGIRDDECTTTFN
jgi:subtilisin family serine protease